MDHSRANQASWTSLVHDASSLVHDAWSKRRHVCRSSPQSLHVVPQGGRCDRMAPTHRSTKPRWWIRPPSMAPRCAGGACDVGAPPWCRRRPRGSRASKRRCRRPGPGCKPSRRRPPHAPPSLPVQFVRGPGGLSPDQVSAVLGKAAARGRRAAGARPAVAPSSLGGAARAAAAGVRPAVAPPSLGGAARAAAAGVGAAVPPPPRLGGGARMAAAGVGAAAPPPPRLGGGVRVAAAGVGTAADVGAAVPPPRLGGGARAAAAGVGAAVPPLRLGGGARAQWRQAWARWRYHRLSTGSVAARGQWRQA